MLIRTEFEDHVLEYEPNRLSPKCLGIARFTPWRARPEAAHVVQRLRARRRGPAGDGGHKADHHLPRARNDLCARAGRLAPLPLAFPHNFLVDLNVVIKLRQLRRGGIVSDGAELQWWAQFFQSGNALFNPLPFAMEGGLRRKPSFAEFKDASDEGASKLVEAFPRCHVF